MMYMVKNVRNSFNKPNLGKKKDNVAKKQTTKIKAETNKSSCLKMFFVNLCSKFPFIVIQSLRSYI